MKFYQIDTDVGPQLVVRKDEAKKLDPNFRKVDIPTDAEGLRTHINQLMAISNAREDEHAGLPVPEPVRVTPTALNGYAEWSTKLDESWEKLPLAHKLHYASLAMEAAREALP